MLTTHRHIHYTTFRGRQADLRRLIYIAAFRKRILEEGSLPAMTEALDNVVCKRPQLAAINGRPC